MIAIPSPKSLLIITIFAFHTSGAIGSVHLPLVQHHLIANHVRIVVFLSCDQRTQIESVRLAYRLNLMASSVDIRQWFGSDSDNSNETGTDNAQTTFNDDSPIGVEFRRLFRPCNHRIGIVLDLECPLRAVRSVLAAASQRIYFHHRYYWLMFASNEEQLHRLLEHENVNVDAEITAATPARLDGDNSVDANGAASGWDLWDVYNPSFVRGGRLNVTHLQRWDATTTVARLPIDRMSKYESRRDFQGLKLKGVLTIVEIPTNYTFRTALDSAAFPHLDSMNRFNYRMFRMMEEMHNFSIYVMRTHDWGYTVNDTWNGAIGFVVRNEVDVAMTNLRWSPERFGFYESTGVTYHVRVLFMFRHPKTSLAAGNIFVQPFVTVVWVVTVAVGVVSAYLMRRMLLLDEAERVDRRRATGEPVDTTWSAALLMVFGILFQQGYDVEPNRISARIVALSALVLALLLFQFYSSFIVGSLLMEPPKTIKTIRQLYDSGMEVGMDAVSYNRDIFEHAVDEAAIQLYRERILKKNNVFVVNKGLELIKRGGFAYHTDSSSAHIRLRSVLSDSEVCELQEIAYAKPFPCGPIVPNGSPLVELIKIDIRRIYEHGLHAYQMAIWSGGKPVCAQSNAVVVAPIDLEHFSSALYLLAMGMALSAAICAGECCVEWMLKRRQRRREKGRPERQEEMRMQWRMRERLWVLADKMQGMWVFGRGPNKLNGGQKNRDANVEPTTGLPFTH